MSEKLQGPEYQDVVKDRFELFQKIVENSESAKLLGAIIGKMGPSERKKFYPLIKELVSKVDMTAANIGLMYWEKKKAKKK